MEMVSFRVPRWLHDEVKSIADRRLSDKSAMFREALLEWLPRQKIEAIS